MARQAGPKQSGGEPPHSKDRPGGRSRLCSGKSFIIIIINLMAFLISVNHLPANPEPEYLVTLNATDYVQGNIPKKDTRLELNTADEPTSPSTHYSATWHMPCAQDGRYAVWIVGGGSGHFGKSLYSWSLDGGPFQPASNNALIKSTTALGSFNDRQIELAPAVELTAGDHQLTLRVENGPTPAGEQKYIFYLSQVALAKVWEPSPPGQPGRIKLYGGDRVFFIGDSISTDGHYIRDVASAFAKVFPQADIRFQNCDNPGDTAAQGVARLERDVLSLKPSWIVIALGINDARDFTLYRYLRNMRDMIERSKANGMRVMLLTPTVYDEDPAKQPKETSGYIAEMLNNEAVKYHNRALAAMAVEIKSMARQYDALVADVYTPMKQLIAERRTGRNPLDLLPDRLHPTEDGHRLMAIAILKGFGLSNEDIERSGLSIPAPVRSAFGMKKASQPEKKKPR